jgi:hypothetical protein
MPDVRGEARTDLAAAALFCLFERAKGLSFDASTEAAIIGNSG